ncbi:family 1 glycosylhydrolase [Sphingomonas sp. SRS2]|uniref:family 1 glycosylhydrolase n=1 Tax=Sphingomonas sp. SRS2 TaxID=133190 RepID=UPI0009FEBED2|nr:family 1 glycosylhydrolase [Sphingomonas sp. SRS2]
MYKLELWGGAECTVNRVGDVWRDQLHETGHDERPADLDLFARLGIAALRFPILWERVAPERPDLCDWRWTDVGLARLSDLAIRPIAGLIHHGSGPRYTDLLAHDFATGLARHARAAAERYPWIIDWTPVNEPLTTARFSALYGHWYPHRRDERCFWTALLNQVDATRLAMEEIRRVQPAARLIQTEDLGRTYATVSVREQAAFDNVRRWMSWDLLYGRVVPGHDLWKRLVSFGFENRLRAIADAPCPPDIIGVNHYLTSDRLLDHRLHRYPATLRGGNGRRSFVDTEAARALQPPPPGLALALRDAWQRYRTPLAITEVHNGCTREEQMRWTADAWHTSRELRDEGVDVRAVTSWALLGGRGWNTLLTAEGRYEAGVFDVSAGYARATALVPLLASLAAGEKPSHPVLSGAGWWRRDIRLHHGRVPRPAPLQQHVRGWPRPPIHAPPPVLITGATGTLGQALAAACRHRDIAFVLTDRTQLDLSDPRSIDIALDTCRPWSVINAAGWVRVDDAEVEIDACLAANMAAAKSLAAACAQRDIPSTTFSSDLVFDGRAGRSYVEADRPAPLNVYGRSKAQAEQAIGALPGRHLIVRTAAFFSPFDPHNFAVHVVDALREGRVFHAAEDQVVTPTYVPHLCNAVLDLVIDEADGVWHLTNTEALTWAEFARRIAQRCDLNAELIIPVAGRTLGWRATRPASTPLASERGMLMPTLSEALDCFAIELRSRGVVDRRIAA